MRILTRKIWRAFPELDQFDDKTCQQYIRYAQRAKNFWIGAIFVIFAIPVGLAVWRGLLFNIDAIVYYLRDWYNLGIFDDLDDTGENLLVLLRITGYVWCPVFCMLLVRDRWLNRCIRKQISGIKCGACGYSLMGLSLIEDADMPVVICPECGHRIVLGDVGLTPADIDPALLTKD